MTLALVGPRTRAWDHAPNGRRCERGTMGDWISGAEAADIIGVHRNTVYRSLRDPQQRALWWGTQGEGWRTKPLSTRLVYEVSRARVEYLAKHGGPIPTGEPGHEDEQS